jgi:tRNA/tmRNA/rRNA uracil-C5-methylase (TrmA/RlmC/RlmD family)
VHPQTLHAHHAYSAGVPESSTADGPLSPQEALSHGYVTGQEVEVTLESVAHGGHCIARHDGLVIFVRHGLPGERVTVRITEVSPRYLRADAVSITQPNPARVTAECPAYRPGGCGGCDFAHAALTHQGGVAPDEVDSLLAEGMADLGLARGWRSKMHYRTLQHGTSASIALHAHRSDVLVDATGCLIAEPSGHALARQAAGDFPRSSSILMAVGDGGPVVDVIDSDDDQSAGNPGEHSFVGHHVVVKGRTITFHTRIDGFWQVHPLLAQELVDTVLDWAAPAPGEHWWDLYAGVAPIGAALALSVGPRGQVDAVEASGVAAREARRVGRSIAPDGVLRVHRSDTRRWLGSKLRSRQSRAPHVHGVILDPPRSGAGRAVLASVAVARPRVIMYVACDPIALGRDIATMNGLGYRLTRLRAWDAFPHTHHFETVAAFVPVDQIS